MSYSSHWQSVTRVKSLLDPITYAFSLSFFLITELKKASLSDQRCMRTQRRGTRPDDEDGPGGALVRQGG